jgi:hypothetical protein
MTKRWLVLVGALAAGACGRVAAPAAATDVPQAGAGDPVEASGKGSGLPLCEVYVEELQSPHRIRAWYGSERPGVCYPADEPLALWHPLWVQVDFQTQQLAMEVMDYPSGRRVDPMVPRGWYMLPTGPPGTYEVQARTGYNGGRATFQVIVARSGAFSIRRK